MARQDLQAAGFVGLTLLPVNFEQNCKNCHARELEFDVYHLLGSGTGPAPQSKDAMTIHQYVAGSYRQALAAHP